MKNIKKIIGIIITICMVLQILPVFASQTQAEATAAEINYIINDEFSADSFNGWTLVKDEGHSSIADDLLSTEELDDGDYALKYVATSDSKTWRYTHIKRVLDESVSLSGEKDVVIETRIQTTGTNRAFLKYNLTTYPQFENEWNYGWGMLIGYDGSNIFAPNGYKPSATTSLYTYWTNYSLAEDAGSNWYTYKIVIHGGEIDETNHTATGNTMDVTVTDDNGDIIKNAEGLSIDFPNNSSWENVNNKGNANITDYNWIEDALNSLDFRLRGEETLLVDYVRVYELFDADMIVDSSVAPNADITVTVDTQTGCEAFKDAFLLYDKNGNVVITENSIDSTNKVVTLSPIDTLEDGEKYTVKLTLSAVPGNYTFATTEKTLNASSVKYYVNDTFGENDLNGWILVKDAGKTTSETTTLSSVEIADEPDNYALEYVSAATPAANWRYNYITRDLEEAVAFDKDKEIVIETRIKTTGTNRAFLKYNLVSYPQFENEWNYGWGMLIGYDGSNIFAPNGYKPSATTNLYTYWTNYSLAEYDGSSWYTYKIVIHGGEIDETNHTATGNTMDVTVTDDNGDIIKKAEGLSIDFPNNSSWENVNNKGNANISDLNWVEDALNSLDFKLRSQETLLVDYIKVYEQLGADMSVDAFITPYEDIRITVDTKADVDVLVDTFVLYDANGNRIEASNSVDSENKVVILSPETPLTVGEKYTVKVDYQSAPLNYVFTSTEKTFTVSNVKYILYDEFSDGDVCGWEREALEQSTIAATVGTEDLGNGNYALTYESVKTSTDNRYSDWAGEHLVRNAFGDGLEFIEGEDVVIETRVKSNGTGRYFLKMNEPLTEGYESWNYNWGTLFGNSDGSFFTPNGWKKNDVGDYATQSNQAPANITIDGLGDKWCTVRVKIHGTTKTASYEVTPEGGTATKLNYMNIDYPDVANMEESKIEALMLKLRSAEKLSVDYIKVYRAKSANVAVDCTDILGNATINAYITTGEEAFDNLENYVALYNGEEKVNANITNEDGSNKVTIDPVENLALGTYTVKFDKDALLMKGYLIDGKPEIDVNVISSTNVNETFEDITTDDLSANGWYFRNDGLTNVTRNAEIVTEDGNNFLRISVDGDLELLEGKLVAYSKDLTNAKFVRDMENSTVMELKLRTNLNTVRKYFKYNYPTTGNISTNAYNEHGWNTRVGAVMDAGKFSIAYGDYSYNYSGRMQGKPENVATYETNKWYTVKTVFDNTQSKATSYIYDEEGVLVGSAEDKELSAWWFNYYDYDKTTPLVMHTIEDLTFQFRPETKNAAVTNEQFDVDDIKLYNIRVCDESVNAVFKSNDEVIDAIGREVTVIVPEFTIQTENDQTKDYYIIAAVYEKDKLLTSQFVPVTVSGSDTITLDAITVDPQNTDIEVRAYIWDKNLAPVLSTPTIIKPLVCEVYLATDGNDLNTGEATSPVATLNRAIDIINEAPDEGYITSKIIVKDGNYELTGETIEIGSNVKTDSLVIQAENEAKFINGVVFNISDATKAPDTIKARLANQNVKDNLYMIDLTTKVDLEDIPGVSLPGPYSYSANGLNTPDGKFVIDESRIATCEMFFDNKPMTLARYPDNEYEVLEEGKFSYDANSRTRYWMDDAIGTDNYIALENRVTDGFTLTLDRAKNWGKADQALMFGYWYYDWATQTIPVASIDTANGVITSKYPSHYGLYKTQRYYVYNLLEEITQPNEYFIDRTTGIMYFYKSSDARPEDEIIMSLYNNKIFNIQASNVTIDGLTFTASRDAAIYSKGNNVVIKNCEISNTAGVAVELDGTNSVLEYCNIHDVNGGVKLNGGNTATLTPGNNKVLNNTITNFSRLSKTYTDAIEINGVGNKASHNKISEGEHLAMRFSGVDNEISYNEISNVLKETDEAGAIYAGRSWTSRDNVVKYNYFHDLVSSEKTTMPICGIMLDDHFSGVEIFGNIFSNVAGYGIKGTGRDLVISNNIFEKCTSGALRLTDATGNASSYSTHIKNIAKYYGNDIWFERFGLQLFTEDGTSYNPDLVNSANVVYTNNFATDVASGADFGSVTEASGAKEPNKTFAVTNPLNGNYENNGAVITPYLEGFINIPFEQIGINGTAGR